MALYRVICMDPRHLQRLSVCGRYSGRLRPGRVCLCYLPMAHAAALGMDADRVTAAIVETSEVARDVIAGLGS